MLTYSNWWSSSLPASELRDHIQWLLPFHSVGPQQILCPPIFVCALGAVTNAAIVSSSFHQFSSLPCIAPLLMTPLISLQPGLGSHLFVLRSTTTPLDERSFLIPSQRPINSPHGWKCNSRLREGGKRSGASCLEEKHLHDHCLCDVLRTSGVKPRSIADVFLVVHGVVDVA
jgi:hypothetical protein